MTSKSTLLTAFNDHFMEFIIDVNNVFPNDSDLVAAKNSITMLRKANPKMCIEIWNTHVVGKYKDQIEAGNMDFFINKDYADDVQNTSNSDKIMDAINRLRNPIKLMTPEDQKKTMKYIQNLTRLSGMYMQL